MQRSFILSWVVPTEKTLILTDIVIKPHQCPDEFPFILHQHPDTGADTPVDEFEGENSARHCADVLLLGEIEGDSDE
jgi:hypothetical protein